MLFLLSIFLFYDVYVYQVKKCVGFYWVYRGDKYYKKNKTQHAIDCYKKALTYYPEHYRARYNLANIYVVYEDYYSALEQYSKALEIKPDFMIARIDYALVLSSAAFNHDKAISEYKKAIEKKPKWIYIPFFINNRKTYNYNSAVAYYNMGLAYRAKSLLVGENKFSAREYLRLSVEAYKKALQMKRFCFLFNQPGGQWSWRPPSMCMCMWGTVSPASGPLLITVRKPFSRPHCFAIFGTARSIFPSISASSGFAASMRAMGFIGKSSACTGA